MRFPVSVILYFVFISYTDHLPARKYFEGTVTYKVTIESGNLKADSALSKVFGTGSTLFFKDGNFLHRYDSGLLVMDLYNRMANKAYFKQSGNDTTFWLDGRSKGNTIINFSFTPKKEKVLGIDCDELIIYYQDKTVTDYYNDDSLAIEGGLMKELLLDGENMIDAKENAIYLKHRTRYPKFTVTETATKFSRESINTSIFFIPSNAIFKKAE